MTVQPLPRRPRTRAAKLVITGPFDAGKTTFVTTLAGSNVLTTEQRVTSEDDHSSGRTTVAMDFGRIPLGDDLALSLFGTPGQQRFDFMWDILAEGMLGYVMIVDASRDSCLPEARRIRRRFERFADVPSVVAINKCTGTPDTAVRRVRRELELPPDLPVLAADARDLDDVKRVVVAVFEQALARLGATEGERRHLGGLGDAG